MQKIIKSICKNIENQNNIKILFAVENGSRAWRMDSKDSDYDIRFVFVRPVKEYHRLKSQKEVIDSFYDLNGEKCEQKKALIDIVGWDVHKFFKLLSKSNPTTIEWLMTDIIYYGKQNTNLKNYALKNFNEMALYYHYKSLCENSYKNHLKNKSKTTYKRYLYAFRGLVNALWVKNKKSIPPISFPQTLAQSKEFIDKNIIKKLQKIIILKKQGKEKELIETIPRFEEDIERFLNSDYQKPEKLECSNLEVLNSELEKTIFPKF